MAIGRGKRAGPIGRSKNMFGSSLQLGSDKCKTYYPTTTSTTTTTTTSTTTTTTTT